LVRRQKTADIPLATDAGGYHQVARDLCAVLARHGFALRPAKPGWWVSAPLRILTALGGPAFSSYVPDRLEHFKAADLDLSLYPSGVLLRGREQRLTWAHGLIAEAAIRTEGFQTVDPKARELENQIRRVWKLKEERAWAEASFPQWPERLKQLTQALGRLDVPFDEWQLLYRQLVQLDRQLRGIPQLIDATAPAASATPPNREQRRASELPAGTLIGEIVEKIGLLAKRQVELAKVEIAADLRREIKFVAGLGVAGIGGVIALCLLIVTAVLALGMIMPPWLAGLAVSAVLAGVAATSAALSGRKRVRQPLSRTRAELREDVRMVKERSI
jgi:hypothetical protein